MTIMTNIFYVMWLCLVSFSSIYLCIESSSVGEGQSTSIYILFFCIPRPHTLWIFGLLYHEHNVRAQTHDITTAS